MIKAAWQRNDRNEFKRIHGYSQTAHYSTGMKRQSILERDNFSCVMCGMNDAEHKKKWGRPITIDHIDKNRKNNTENNLRTLCLSCHGRKDISPSLIARKVEKHKSEILHMRRENITYQSIADSFGFSIASIWKWVKKWEKEEIQCQTKKI